MNVGTRVVVLKISLIEGIKWMKEVLSLLGIGIRTKQGCVLVKNN